MVYYSSASLDATFAALSDPTRRAILARLARGESSVTELAEPFRISLPAVSKHLRVLEHARLLTREKDGRVHRCRLSPRPLRDAEHWIQFYQRFWQEQFDSLSEYLENAKHKEASWDHPQPGRKPWSRSGEHLPRCRRKSSRHGRTPAK